MCREFKKTNIVPGGFSEYIYVSEAHLENTVAKIPDNLDSIEASFMEPVACCLRAVKRAAIKSGHTAKSEKTCTYRKKPQENVLIIGLGSIGLLMGQIAKHFGRSRITIWEITTGRKWKHLYASRYTTNDRV